VTEQPRLTPELYRERHIVERKVALMNLHRALAERFDTERDPSLRQRFAERYRELIGVYPGERERFRAALDRVNEGGGATVQDVIDRIRSQSNRLI
jgi:hypothetical protein